MAKEEKKKHEIIKGEMYAVNSYLAKVQDEKDAARKKANEEIKYKFEDLGKKDIRDKYLNTYKKHLTDKAAENLKFDVKKLGYDSREAKMLTEFYTGITFRELDRIVESKGEKFKPDDINNYLLRQKGRFEQPHYQGLSRHVTEEKDIPHALKALGIEDLVDEKKVTISHMPELFGMHAGEGINEGDIPLELKKKKKKKAA